MRLPIHSAFRIPHSELRKALMGEKGYSFFDHTADVGMVAVGATLADLFANAAHGMTELLIGESPVEPRDTRAVALRAGSSEALLAVWLKELLFWFETDRFLPAVFLLDEAGRTELRGRIIGEPFDPSRHAHGTEIKGLTRHQFSVVETPAGWEARVIFDV